MNLRHAIYRVRSYYRLHGLAALIFRGVEYILFRLRLNLGAKAVVPRSFVLPGLASPLSALNLSFNPSGDKTIYLVTDSIGSSSLFGGVGTALILCCLMAKRGNAKLTIVTRTEASNPKDFDDFAQLMRLQVNFEVSFVFAPPADSKVSVSVNERSLFVTTSWWTTNAVLKAVPSLQVVYLLQEDERMFYPFGDDRLQCEQTILSHGLRIVVNTELLYTHLDAEGLFRNAAQVSFFEPAFATHLYEAYPGDDVSIEQKNPKRRRLFFYARPNNPRNLYGFGCKLLRAAVFQGVLSLAHWDICFVGKHLRPEPLGPEIPVTLVDGMSWLEYAQFLRTVDLGLCLMYTPHPSYPPLDLAASGAVVLTNTYGKKTSLSQYSDNLVLSSLDMDAMLQGLKTCLKLVNDAEARATNFKSQTMLTDWNKALAEVVEKFGT